MKGDEGVISLSLKPVFDKIIEFGSSSYIYMSNWLQANTKASHEDQRHTTMLIRPNSCNRSTGAALLVNYSDTSFP